MLHLLYEALTSPKGIVVESDDPERLRQKLYALRREIADASLEALSFVISPVNPGHLWIVKKEAA